MTVNGERRGVDRQRLGVILFVLPGGMGAATQTKGIRGGFDISI